MFRSLTLLTLFVTQIFGGEMFLEDAKNFYTKETILNLSQSFATAAILANSPLDRESDRFYQDNIRSSKTDSAAKIFKAFGSNKPLSIVFFSGMAAGYIFRNTKPGEKIHEFCLSSFRAITVGMPTLIAGQSLLGADRPNQCTTSYWKPFHNDHGISGHAFMGAVPFITAANMTENRALKTLLYSASFLTGLSRINDTSHYTSQVILGWALAYNSCRAVNSSNYTLEISSDKISLGGAF